jgi:phosphatidylinositol dimannoside acyltransferase
VIALRSMLATDGALWRRLAYAGARWGPRPWLQLSPPAFGLLFAAALPVQRRAIRDNLRRVLGTRSAWEEGFDVARTFSSYARCLAESLAADRPEAAAAHGRLRGGDAVRSALGAGSGLVVVTAHTGAWDVGARLLTNDFGARLALVMVREPSDRARSLHDDVRRRAGVEVVHVGDHPLDVLPLVRHLRSGGVVAAQLDRAPPSARRLQVSLFDQPYEVPEGPFVLAARAGVPLVPLFARRVGFFDYEFSAAPAIQLPRKPSATELAVAAGRAAAEMERFIRAHPTQWFHFGPGR